MSVRVPKGLIDAHEFERTRPSGATDHAQGIRFPLGPRNTYTHDYSCPASKSSLVACPMTRVLSTLRRAPEDDLRQQDGLVHTVAS